MTIGDIITCVKINGNASQYYNSVLHHLTIGCDYVINALKKSECCGKPLVDVGIRAYDSNNTTKTKKENTLTTCTCGKTEIVKDNRYWVPISFFKLKNPALSDITIEDLMKL